MKRFQRLALGAAVLLFVAVSAPGNAAIRPSLAQGGGLSWGPDERVNDDTGGVDQTAPCIAVDNVGNSYAVWDDTRGVDTIGRQISFSFRPFGGAWGSNEQVSTERGFSPDIAVDKDGNLYAIWGGLDRNIYFSSRPVGGSWGASERVDDTSDISSKPSIAVDGVGNVYAVWQEIERVTFPASPNVRIFFSFRPAGGTWGPSEQVADPGDPRIQDRFLPVACQSLAVDQEGNAYLVWTRGYSITVVFAEVHFSFRPVGGPWQPSVKVNDTFVVSAHQPSIAVDGSGNAYADWADSREGGTGIFFDVRPAGGNWGTDERVNVSGLGGNPSIAVNGAGDAIAVWLGGEGPGDAKILSSFRPSGGSWSSVNNQVNDLPAFDRWGTIDAGIDDAGNGYAIWESDALVEFDDDVFFSTTGPTGLPPEPEPVSPDSEGNVGLWTSLALDASGSPVVSYWDTTNNDLKVLHCGNPTCTAGNTIVSPDTAGSVGVFTSLALDTSGHPVVSYHDATNGDLKVLHCGNPSCTSGNTSTSPDTAGDVGEWTSLALDSSGNPVVSYYDATNGDLKVLHCGNPTCTAGNVITTPDTEGFVGQYTSLELNADGNPVVAYYREFVGDLKVLHCGDPTCSSGNTTTVLAPGSAVGTAPHISLALDASGNPVVSFGRLLPGVLKVIHCGNPTCTADNIIATPDSPNEGAFTSLALDGSGNPVVSYQNYAHDDLKVLHCGNPTCTAGNTIATPDTVGDVGFYTSLALDGSGNPVVSYYDGTNGDLKVLHCINPSCLAPGPPAEPELSLSIVAPSEVTIADGSYVPFEVGATVSNASTSPAGAEDVQATIDIDLQPGLRLVDGETATKVLGEIPVGAISEASWMVVPEPQRYSDLFDFSVEVVATNLSESLVESGEIFVPGIIPRKVIVFLQGINSRLDVSLLLTGQETRFNDLKDVLLQRGYTAADWLEFSYSGGRVLADGEWRPNGYECEATWREIWTDPADPDISSADHLHLMLNAYLRSNPNARFVLVGHSLGGLVAFQELEFVARGFYEEPGIVSAVVTVDSPLAGVSSIFAEEIFRLLPREVFGCPEAVLDSTAGDQLQQLASDRNLQKLLSGTARRANAVYGVSVLTAGNVRDCLYGPVFCGFRGFRNQVTTQFIAEPGISRLPRNLGNDFHIEELKFDTGHDRMLRKEFDQLDDISAFIGEQLL